MRVKLYNKREDRSKKCNKDLHTLIDFKDVANYSKTELLSELTDAYVNNQKNYAFGKARLNAFNVHNLGDLIKGEFVSTGIIHYDFDKITRNEIAQIQKILTTAYATMESPSGAGLKIFYLVENLTEKNFKIVYENIGIKIAEKLNADLNTTKYTYGQGIDSSCNDLNRLCYVGTNFTVVGDDKDFFDANQFYSETDLEDIEKKEFRFSNDNSHIIQLVDDVALKGVKLVERFNGFRDLIFSFVYLCKVENYQKSLVLELVKKVLCEEKIFISSTGNSYDIEYWFGNLYESYDTSFSAGASKALTIGHFVDLCKKNGLTIRAKRRTYKLKFVKKGDAIKDYLTDKRIKLASCKYSKNTLLQENDFYFPLENESVFTEWVNYNDTFINVYSEKKNKDGEIREELMKNIRMDKCESLRVSSNEWKAFLTNQITTNEVDTSKLFFESLLNKYSKDELIGLSEINEFLNLFIQFPKNCDRDLTKRKLKTALLSVIDKALGNKNEWCIVLLSQGEGIGKTELIRNGLFKPFVDFKLHAPFKLTDDEWKSDELLSSIVIAEIDEKGVGQNQTNILKRMVSLDSTFQKDKHSNVNKRRTSRATILFTSNDYKFLKNNQEQNRRFLIFDFGNGSNINDRLWTLDENKVVKSKFESIDFEKLWAELYFFYKNSARKVDVDFLEIIEDNEKYKVSTSFENRNNTVLQMFVNDIEDKNGIPVMLHASDILLIMQIVAGGNFAFSQKDKNLITQHFSDKEYQREKRTCGLCDVKGTIIEKLFNFEAIELENEKWENKRSYRFIIKIKEEIISEIKKYKQNQTITHDFLSDNHRQVFA
jgi:VirE N-terminal domain.